MWGAVSEKEACLVAFARVPVRVHVLPDPLGSLSREQDSETIFF